MIVRLILNVNVQKFRPLLTSGIVSRPAPHVASRCGVAAYHTCTAIYTHSFQRRDAESVMRVGSSSERSFLGRRFGGVCEKCGSTNRWLIDGHATLGRPICT